ncbi:hypothetical protein TWF481_003085 [Arthrobotrys musiformis]|uniref:Mid2 domain-containing protein n=1 Tax=Arthrobotrys musiformis TaxID=47236 RepID=A0AAV9VQ98_9PEZI
MATRTTSSSPKPTTSYPLTTQFIPATSCSSQYYYGVFGTFTPDAVMVNGPPPGADDAAKECWPQDFNTVVGGGTSTRTFYSPGICPSGWSTASQMYVSRTVYAYCCFTGYTLLADALPPRFLPSTIPLSTFTDDDYGGTPVCFQPLPTGIVVEYQQLDGERHTTNLRKDHSVVHYPVRVKYQASDFSLFPPDAQPTDLSEEFLADLEPYIRSGLVTIATNTGSRQTTSDGTSTGSGTGTGAIPSETGNGKEETPDEGRTGTIAIAVGVTVSVVIVLAVAGYFLFAWRRKKSRAHKSGFGTATGPYKQHQNNDSHIGGIQDLPDNTGGIALAEVGSGGWSKGHQ